MRPLFVFLFLAVVLGAAPAVAHADRPTSGDMSIHSGRTLGNGETVISAGAGWPGARLQATFAPSSTFNVGLRGSFLYGSPIIGFNIGIGGEVGVPMRIHVFGQGEWDLAVALTPYVALGQGAVVGVRDESVFDDDFGWGLMGEAGLLAGFHPNTTTTLTLGFLAGVGAIGSPDADRTEAALTLTPKIGLEFLLDRDLMLFIDVEAGGGFSTGSPFHDSAVVRGFFGGAFLL